MNKVSLITLCVGIVGLTEMAVVALFYGELYDAGMLEWVGPGTAVIQLSLIFAAVGLVGAAVFPFELATRDFRLVGYKTVAFLVYVAEFCWVFWTYGTSF